MFEIDNVKTTATIWSELDCRDKVENLNFTNFLDVRCKKCENINQRKKFEDTLHRDRVDKLQYSYWEKENVELKNEDCTLMTHSLKEEQETNECQTASNYSMTCQN